MTFRQTQPRVVKEAGQGDRTALALLCQWYWYPIYSFLRQCMASVDLQRGRFRCWLSECAKHYLLNELDQARTKKSGGGAIVVSIDACVAEERFQLEARESTAPGPSAIFRVIDREVALLVIERALGKLRARCRGAEMGIHIDQLQQGIRGTSTPPGESDEALLARDLVHWLSDIPINPRRSVWARAFSWVSRHPWRSLGAVAAVAAVVAGVGIRERVERDEWATNASFASAQAGTMLCQLREYGDRVAKAAEDPAIAVLLTARPVTDGSPAPLDSYSQKLGVDLFAMGTDGYLRAQSPLPPEGGVFGRSFAFRDYFRGARVLAAAKRSGAYLARTLRSESDGKFKFGFAAPVFDRGEWVGVLVALKDVSSVFGEVHLVDPASGGRRMTALLGPRDRERKDAPTHRCRRG